MRQPVLQSEWHDWKQHNVTKALVHDLNAMREQYKEDMAEGHHDTQFQTIKGVCQGLKDAIEYIAHKFDIVKTDEENGEDKDGN